MDDTDEGVDLDSVMNVMLPLELYKLPSFPAEHSFTRLYGLLLTHFTENRPQAITPGFLFSISDILSCHVQFCHSNIVPLVLRRLRTWRLLSPEEKTRAAIENLALDLAALVNVHSRPVEAPRLRITWIRVESETDLKLSTSTAVALESDEVRSGSPRRVDPRSASSACSNGPLHEMVSYRSGCCACRRPRNYGDNTAEPRTPVVTLPPMQATANTTVMVPSLFLRKTPRKTPRKAGKHEDDENVPAVPVSANARLPYRKSNSGNPAPRPVAVRTKSASTYQTPLSRSSFSYNSSTKNSNTSLSALNNLPRSSSSLSQAAAQPHTRSQPASHLSPRTSPTKPKSRSVTKVPAVPVSREVLKPGGTSANAHARVIETVRLVSLPRFPGPKKAP